MPIEEFYRLTLTMGDRPDLGTARCTNVFYFRYLNLSSLTDYQSARDLGLSLTATFGWLDLWQNLYNLSAFIKSAQVVRVQPRPSPTADFSIDYDYWQGNRLLQSGNYYLTVNVRWLRDDDESTLPYTQIGLRVKRDIEDDDVWLAASIAISQWANFHHSTWSTPQGNDVQGAYRRADGSFGIITGHIFDKWAGRRLTRRGRI